MQRIRKALVVGGGIGGPVLAMWLRRLGVEVVVAEARSGAALAEGAFLGVAPNGMNVLGALGIAEAVMARGAPCAAFHFSNHLGAPLGIIDRSHDRARFGFPLTMIRRSELHLTLAEEAAARGVDLRFGKRLVGLDRRPDAVVASFDDGSEECADVVVGCDGIHSQVRRLVLEGAPRALGLLDCGGFATGVAVPFPPGINAMVFGHHAFFGAFRTDEGEIWWFHNGPVAATEVRERLLALHRDDPSWIGEVIAATPRILGPWSLSEVPTLRRWFDGRICLMGDAAHAMSPSAGQGASLAMEDAVVLAQCIRDLGAPEAAFAAFEARRRGRVEAIARIARRNGNGKAPSGAVSRWLRDRALKIFLPRGAAAQDRGYAHRIAWEEQVA